MLLNPESFINKNAHLGSILINKDIKISHTHIEEKKPHLQKVIKVIAILLHTAITLSHTSYDILFYTESIQIVTLLF